VLLAAAKVLLYRYTMQPDLVVGVPTAGRNRVETEPVVGPFLNMLAVRTRLEPEASFRALVDRVAATVLASQEHQDMPFDKLVEVVAPERDPSRHPLFQVIFSLNQRSRIEHRFDGVETEYFEAEHKTARVDLAFELWDEPDGRVTGALELNRDLFELETIVRMERHYVHLLESLMAEPGLAVARASLLTAQERERLLPEPTAPTWTLPSDGGDDRVVSRWAARQPEATAVVSPDGALTYAALDRRAARLARRLRDAGVDGSQPVAMILPNGPEHVTAMLGVLKACAPYVCLDPGYPAARIRQILDDVTPAAVIVSTPFSGAPPAWYRSDDGVPVIALAPVDAPALEPEPDESPAGEVRIPEAEMPIYLAYTSGSTGRPKGVVLTHGGFRYVVEWFAERFGLAPGKSVAQWISVVHDPCYVEVFGALVAGATVAVPSPTMRQDPALVAEWIEREGISLIQMVPSFCRQLLELDSVRTRSMRLASLDAVLLVGEELPVQLARTWRRRFGDRPQLWNVYGPTESILVTAQEVDAATARRRTIPVGTPVDGCRLFVLDANDEACPIGVPGMIFIRSPYLALGYHGMPEDTEAAFIQNPLHDRYPDRVYRSGDLGVWLADEMLAFLGRADRQVKIRGLRVELSEIEATLRRHPAVREGAVVLQPRSDADDPAIIAFAELADEASDAALQAWLEERLPVFMVPRTVTVLERLPRTTTGKIDRRALATVASKSRVGGARRYQPPANEIEAAVASLYAELLGVERAGRLDGFFDLGGSSLLAAKLVNRLRGRLSVSLYVQHLFSHPTVAALASLIAEPRATDDGASSPEALSRLLEEVTEMSDVEAAGLLTQLEERGRSRGTRRPVAKPTNRR
jgi:amino acid adenylation domain-containing protein